MAMDTDAAHSYVYAKACGMLSKSYVGSRARSLFSVSSLHELWSLLFSEPVPAVPETLLAKQIETDSEKKFIRDYITLLSSYEKPAPLLTALLHYYDFENCKELGTALSRGEKLMPRITDISPYNLIDYTKWPKLSAMTKKSTLRRYTKPPALKEQQASDYALDVQYVQETWASADGMEGECREAVKKLLAEKFRMENILWSLRLRTYYHMPKEEVLLHLAYSGKTRSKTDTLAGEAIKTLDWELDSWEQWKNWKYSSLLNPHEEGAVWFVDPRWISSSFTKRYVREAERLFHQFPGTSCPLASWFIVKQRELDTIRTACEHLRLNTDREQAMLVAGLSEARNG